MAGAGTLPSSVSAQPAVTWSSQPRGYRGRTNEAPVVAGVPAPSLPPPPRALQGLPPL